LATPSAVQVMVLAFQGSAAVRTNRLKLEPFVNASNVEIMAADGAKVGIGVETNAAVGVAGENLPFSPRGATERGQTTVFGWIDLLQGAIVAFGGDLVGSRTGSVAGGRSSCSLALLAPLIALLEDEPPCRNEDCDTKYLREDDDKYNSSW
jgi:hypothetical protein